MRHAFIMLAFIAASLLSGTTASAQDFGPNSYEYQIKWKWGLVDMTAAHGRIDTQCVDGNFFGTLNGSSIDWRGHVYSVSDTLRASVTPTAQHTEYVNGWYTKPKAGTEADLQDPQDYRTILGQGSLSASPATMEAVETTANMLSIHYYAHAIDFDSMHPGEIVTIPISQEGETPENLVITYKGRGESPSGSYPGEVYNVELNYSYNGSPSEYPVTCEITTDTHVPVYYAADIRIGHVAMIAD